MRWLNFCKYAKKSLVFTLLKTFYSSNFSTIMPASSKSCMENSSG